MIETAKHAAGSWPAASPRLQVEDFDWRINVEAVPDDEDTQGTWGAPLSLFAQLQIGQTSFHVNAHLAEWIVDGFYYTGEPPARARFVLGRDEDWTGGLWEALGMSDPPLTVAIPGVGQGREYCIFIEPHGR